MDLQGCNADFAVGCTYKYLNGGPGAPAFIYVSPRHAETVDPALSGWLGHAAPFAFDPAYRPGAGIERMRVGTPPVLAMAALDAALDIWDAVDMAALRAQSIALSERFIARVEQACPALGSWPHLAIRTCAAARFHFTFEHGYAAMQACIAEGVIGDFRAPDIMRFGITPLYLDTADIDHAADVLIGVIDEKRWKNPEFQIRSRVT